MPVQDQRTAKPGPVAGSYSQALRAHWTDIAIEISSTFVGRHMDKSAALRWISTVLILIVAGIIAALFRHSWVVAISVAAAGIAVLRLR